jgi:hypothetical protein
VGNVKPEYVSRVAKLLKFLIVMHDLICTGFSLPLGVMKAHSKHRWELLVTSNFCKFMRNCFGGISTT